MARANGAAFVGGVELVEDVSSQGSLKMCSQGGQPLIPSRGNPTC